MTAVEYPWRWLTDSVGAIFSLRFPWVDTLRRAAVQAESVCVLFPDAAGPRAAWVLWLIDLINRESASPCLEVPSDFSAILQTLADVRRIDGWQGRGADGLARPFLAEC